jgi:hypothetical protein
MYAKINNGVITIYPYTLTQLRADNPYTSFTQSPTAEELLKFNTVIVQSTTAPILNYTENVTEALPEFNSGKWLQKWVISQATEQEISDRISIKSSNVRDQRNQLLAQSDWTQVLDAPVDQQAWAQYRQQLRDVTTQPGFPLEVVWPQQPQ